MSPLRLNRRLLLTGATATAASSAWPCAYATDGAASKFDAEFLQRGVTGTFVRLDIATDRVTLINEVRAKKRYIPASTFKIANSLIAIETRAVTGPGEVFRWDGQPALMKDWESDMTLAEAIRVSNVPIYQEIARRVGLKAYEDWLDRIGYGNANPGSAVDRFWLDGPLTISAIEQTSFLAALALQELPMSKAAQSAVKAMLLQETRGSRSLFAKAGWLRTTTPQIGWWVGWVEGNGRIDTFALNIDIASESDLPKRREIGLAILSRMGLYGA